MILNPFEVTAPNYTIVELDRPQGSGLIKYIIDDDGGVLGLTFRQDTTPFALVFGKIQTQMQTTPQALPGGRIPVALKTPSRDILFQTELESETLGTIPCEEHDYVWWGRFPSVLIDKTVITPRLPVALPTSLLSSNPQEFLNRSTPSLPTLFAGIYARWENTQATHY